MEKKEHASSGMLTKVIVLQQVEVAHLLPHGDLLHSALVQVKLLRNVNIAATQQNRQSIIYLVA